MCLAKVVETRRDDFHNNASCFEKHDQIGLFDDLSRVHLTMPDRKSVQQGKCLRQILHFPLCELRVAPIELEQRGFWQDDSDPALTTEFANLCQFFGKHALGESQAQEDI